MHIIVCIKQVPDATSVDIDPKTGNLIREGADFKINHYDLHALEAALLLKEQNGATVTALSMGPPQAAQAVKEALMLGADHGVLISDRAFAGADVLATSYTLSQAISTLPAYDLIICGKQTTDGDTAQVGPSLAEFLSIAHVSWVSDVLSIAADKITARQDLNEIFQDVRLEFPCLITVEKKKSSPRLPSYLRKKQFAQTEIPILTISDLPDQDPAKYGGNGSPTRVEKIFPPTINTDRFLFKESPEQAAAYLYDYLVAKKFIKEDA